MDILFLVGRILFGGYFFMNGLNHFMKNQMLSGYAASKGVPSPKFLVYLSGSMIFLGGLGVILGAYVEISVILIAAFLFVISFKMHDFWKATDPMVRMSDMINFTKNMALLGAALAMLLIPEPWPISLSL